MWSNSRYDVKTKEELISELLELHRKTAELESLLNFAVRGKGGAQEFLKYFSAMEALMDGIAILDNKGIFLYLNSAHAVIYGYESPSELVGKTWKFLYADEELQRLEREVMPELRGRGQWRGEAVGRRKDGSSFFQELSLKASEKGFVCVVRDVTERRKAEEKLRLFSEAVENGPDGIQIVGLDGSIIYSNKAVEGIYGFTGEELRGRHVNEMNVDPELAGREILPSIRAKGGWTGEIMVKHKNGAEFPVLLSTSIVKNGNGEPLAMVGIIRDMTERRRIEEELSRHQEQLKEMVRERTEELEKVNEQLQSEIAERKKMEEEMLKVQKLEYLGVLAGGIAHDFKNILTGILGNINLARMYLYPGEKAFERLEKAEQASLKARDLVQQLFIFSKSGTPVTRKVSIRKIIDESVGYVLQGSRIKCELEIPDHLNDIEVDEGQIRQVVHVLMKNGYEAMPEGGTITVSGENVNAGAVRNLPDPRLAYVRVTFRDNGIGIPPESLSRVFDPYFSTKQKRSGLGLYTAYSIVRLNGGHIEIESAPGRGTAVSLFLPANKRPYTGRLKGRDIRPVSGGRGKILLMEDEEIVQEVAVEMLCNIGYEVDLATNGNEAIELYRRARESGSPYRAVILDLTISKGMGGKEAIRRLQEYDPQIRAILSSGYSADPVLDNYKDYGFCDVVRKPYKVNELSEVIYRAVH